MSGTAGYIYVLVNSAMPGLVKVGKTTRDPVGRAQELSGATGVAAPFIVVFDQMFADCNAAEAAIHRSLDQCGLRPAQNREFFRASPSQVIKLIMAVHAAIGNADLFLEEHASIDDGHGRPSSPWQHLLHQADGCYFGWDNDLEDHHGAYRLYEDAARLGSAEAMDRLGWMNINGDGVRESCLDALQWWKKGAARGNYYCHMSMAKAFVCRGEVKNADKCWAAFFRDRSVAVRGGQLQFDSRERYVDALVSYLIDVNEFGINQEFFDEVRSCKDDIMALLAIQRVSESASDTYKAARWRATWWIEGNQGGDLIAPMSPDQDGRGQSHSERQHLEALVSRLVEADGQEIASSVADDIRGRKVEILHLLAEQRNSGSASNAYKAARWRATWLIEDNMKG